MSTITELSAAQDSPETARQKWLEDRKSAIGASDVAAILGMSPWATAYDVWLEKRDMLEPEKKEKLWIKSGRHYENAVLDYAEQELGKICRNVRIKHPVLPVAATCDAVLFANGESIEAKTTGLHGPVQGMWGDAMTDQVPDYYLIQCHTQIACTTKDIAHLFALIAGRGTVPFRIERLDSVTEMIESLCSDWWERHIIQGIAPPLEIPPSLSVLKRMRRVPKKVVDLGASEAALVCRRLKLKQQEKRVKDKLEEVDAKLILAIGDAEGAKFATGETLTYFETSRKGYVVEPTKFRTLVVKGK